MGIKFANNASSLLAVPALSTDTAITITEADAALFPTLGAGDYVFLTLEDRRVVPNLREIVKCTARSANVLTIVRAQDNTTAQAFFLGAVVSARLTRAALLAFLLEETTRAEAAEAAEAAARAAADTAETAARIAADAAELARALAAETVLQDAIDAEVIARANADGIEAGSRATADAAEASARAAGDATNAAAIAAEATARAAAVTAEASARAAADATEVSARAAGDAANAAAIAAIPSASSTVLTGSAHTDIGGVFSVTFTPAFATNLTFFHVSYGDGTVYPFAPAFFQTLVGNRTGMSCQVQDSGSTPLANLDVFWTAIGY